MKRTAEAPDVAIGMEISAAITGMWVELRLDADAQPGSFLELEVNVDDLYGVQQRARFSMRLEALPILQALIGRVRSEAEARGIGFHLSPPRATTTDSSHGDEETK